MKKRLDATQGSIIKLIFTFSIPLILTTLMQNAFTIIDKAVLGQMADSTAVASVGVTGFITSLAINGFVGFATGAGIILARFVGQKDEKKIRDTIETSLIVSIIFGVFVAIVGIIFAPQLLRMINCPEKCFEGALIYFRFYIASSPAILLYNYGSAIVRTLGDTQRPLYYIIISGITNVVLNVILCLILPQKVAAVAIATVVSVVVKAILITRRIFKFEEVVKLSLKKFRFCFESFKLILRFGIPVAITNLLMPIANLQIAPAINSYGVSATAGNTAATDLFNVVSAFVTGFSAATSTFMGQNIGAQKQDRVKKTFCYTLLLAVVIGGSMGVVFYFAGEFLVGLIIGTADALAIEYAMTRLFYVSLFTFVYAIFTVLGAAEHAYGYPFLGSVSSIVCTLLFRIVWMNWVYPLNPTFSMVMVCFTISWLLTLIFQTVAVTIITVRYRKGIYKKI
ncbi:MAG: MATE family efflux transporter [Ruminococcaceae bacterium]|nr:MATE family efflux transporter [Oscillospiraceae bacterium]